MGRAAFYQSNSSFEPSESLGGVVQHLAHSRNEAF